MTKTDKKTYLILFTVWVFFHLFALFSVELDIEGFQNNHCTPKTDQIWPFVKLSCNNHFGEEFGGLFHHYDFSEFLLYEGLGVFILIIVLIAKN
jgi:hypothetical protein